MSLRRSGRMVVTGVLCSVVLACQAAASPGVRPGWPPSGEPVAVPAIGPDGSIYIRVPEGIAVLNRDGTRRALARSSPLGNPVVGRDGRVYAIRGRGERLMTVSRDGKLREVGGRIAFGKYSELVAVSASGRVAHNLETRQGLAWVETLGVGEALYRAVPGYEYLPGGSLTIRRVSAALESLAPDGQLLWRRALSTDPQALASAPDGDVRLILQGDGLQGHESVVAFDAAGTPQWETRVVGAPLSLAVAPDGATAVLSAEGSYDHGAGYLTSIAPDGSIRFAIALLGAPQRPPLIGKDGTIYASLAGSAVAVSPSGRVRSRFPVVGAPTRMMLGPSGELAFGASSGVFVVDDPGIAPTRPRVRGLTSSAQRFRSAGAVSLCPKGSRGTCTPPSPLGTTLSLAVVRAALAEITVSRVGARRPTIRTTIGSVPKGTLWLRFDGRSLHNRRLRGGPLRGLCSFTNCEPLAPGRYLITLTTRDTSGAVQHHRTQVTIVPA